MNLLNHRWDSGWIMRPGPRALRGLLVAWVSILGWSSGGWIFGGEFEPDGWDTPAFAIAAWSTEDGLPANSISAVLRGRSGYLWVGSSQGVARFDGARFEVFNKANCAALPDNRIKGLFETDHELLISTERGGLVAMRDGKFVRLAEVAKPGDHIVSCLKVAPNEWLLTSYVGQIHRWRAGRLESVSRNRNLGPVLPRWVVRDRQGWVWLLAKESRLMVSRGGELEPFQFRGDLENSSCLGLTVDGEGRVWVATSGGIARWREGDFEMVRLPGWTTNRVCRDVLATRDGGFWIGTQNNNFRKWQGDGWAGPEIHASGVRTFVRVLGEDSSGRLILGGRTPEGLLFMAESGEVVHLTQQTGLPGNTVAAHQIDGEGNLWLGLADGGLVRLRSRLFTLLPGAASQPSAPAQAVCETRDGSVWMGTSMGGMYRYFAGRAVHYSGKDGFPISLALSLCEDRATNLWVGTSWHGVYLFRSNKFPRADQRDLRGWAGSVVVRLRVWIDVVAERQAGSQNSRQYSRVAGHQNAPARCAWPVVDWHGQPRALVLGRRAGPTGFDQRIRGQSDLVFVARWRRRALDR
jgi:ligand-binding sensor domain-containing protein